MALAQVGLGNITHVAANGTTAVYTVGAGKTAYVRALEIHNLDANSDAIVQIHVVPNNGGSAGSKPSCRISDGFNFSGTTTTTTTNPNTTTTTTTVPPGVRTIFTRFYPIVTNN